jgi:hypothetical protein
VSQQGWHEKETERGRADLLLGILANWLGPGLSEEMTLDFTQPVSVFPVLICVASLLMRPPLWSSGQSSWLHNGDVLCFL